MAYKIIGEKVEKGNYSPPPQNGGKAGRGHHEGSIGNLCNEEIKKQMRKVVDSFPFDSVNTAIKKLIS